MSPSDPTHPDRSEPPPSGAFRLSVVTPFWQDRPPEENREVALRADRLGFGELWVGEMATFDAFAFAAAVGGACERVSLTLGPLAVAVRTPMTLAMGTASVAALTGRPTRLALGASSAVVVEEWHGCRWGRTATHLAETAKAVRGLLDGHKVDFDGELARTHGYRLRLPAPGAHVTIAAFGPGAVRAAGRHADRMVLNMVTPEALARLREQLAKAASLAGCPTPALAVWLVCAVEPGDATLRQILRAKVAYLAAPGYGEMFAEAGFADLVRFARTRPHPKEILAAMPAELAVAVGLIGDIESIRARLADYRAAGADEICLVPATADDPGGARTLEAMAALRD